MSGVIPFPAARRRYTGVAIALHWIIAALIIANVALGLGANYIPDSFVRPVVDLHKSFGITVLGLAALRLLWRLGHKPPHLPGSYSKLERFAAHLAHGLLYVLIFALPLSGWMHDSAWKGAPSHPMSLYGIVPFPRIGWIEQMAPAAKEHAHELFFTIHAGAAYMLYGLLALHVLGALKHQFWDREPELQRMLPGSMRTGIQ